MNKKQFLQTAASEATKKNAMLSLILTVVLIATMFLSYITVLNTSIENIPFIKLAMNSASDDTEKEFKELKDELEDALDDAEDQYDEIEDDLSKKEQKLVKKLFKVAKKTSKSISINNTKKLADIMEDIAKEGGAAEDADFFGTSISDMKEAKEVLSLASTAVLICMLFALLFSALGGFLKVKGLVITGLISSVIYSLIFCGFLWLLLIAAVHVALFIFLKKVDDDYKAYNTQYMYQGNVQFVPNQYGAPQYDPNQYGTQYDPNQYDPNQYPPQN